MELSEIRINIDFENLIPKQTAEQFKQLEENILKDGRVRNPLVVWKDHGILVDGHHRLRILKAHPEVEYSVTEQAFEDEDEVKEWIIKNALGTRNLTEMQIMDLRGRLGHARKKRVGEHKGNQYTKTEFPKKEVIPNNYGTAGEIAKELGVSHSTIEKAMYFVDGLDKADSVIPGFKDGVLTGAIKAQKGEVAKMRKQTPEEIKKSVKEIEERKSKKSSDRALFDKTNNIDALMSGVSTTQYGLGELIREVDALGDAFVRSLSSAIKRRKNVMDSYDDSAEEMGNCIDRIIEKLNEMKKGF